MGDPTKNCYNCGNPVSVYASNCSCGAVHDPQPRPAATPPPARKVVPETAQPANIRTWLAGIGMGIHIQAFESNGIDLSLLHDLDDGDLKALGITKLGDRKRILNEIAAVGPIAAKPAAPPPTRATADQSGASAVRSPSGSSSSTEDDDPPPKKRSCLGCLVTVVALFVAGIFVLANLDTPTTQRSSSSSNSSSSSSSSRPARLPVLSPTQAKSTLRGCCHGLGGEWTGRDECYGLGYDAEDKLLGCTGNFIIRFPSGNEHEMSHHIHKYIH